MLGFLTVILLSFLSTYCTFKAHPIDGNSMTPKDRLQEDDDVQHTTTEATTTTEAANQTNIINSVWHKFSNIFRGETTTEAEFETKKEVIMPEDRMPPNEWEETDRETRMAPVDFSRQVRETWEKLHDEGSVHPVHRQQARLKRSAKFEQPFSENEVLTSEVRAAKQQHKHKAFETEKMPSVSVYKKVPVIVDEFDQGETEGGRIKRFSKDSPDWKTEKIAVESDSLENIDNTNYIEETKNKDFPFHSFSIQPIIVEDKFLTDATTVSEQELPPLKIIEY